MDPRDEFIHPWPEKLEGPWKENWYFNFIEGGPRPGGSSPRGHFCRIMFRKLRSLRESQVTG